MEREYTNIPVLKKNKKELLRRKLLRQSEEERIITWDKFLLEATHGT